MFDTEQIPEECFAGKKDQKEDNIFQKVQRFVQNQNEEWIAKLVQTTLNETEMKTATENLQIEKVKKYFSLIIAKMIDLCDKCAEV